MPLVFFMAPNDPRMTSTLDAIVKPPNKGTTRSGRDSGWRRRHCCGGL
jgi:hypothetical protein